MTQTQGDFRSKYTKTNFITRRLLRGFFEAVGELAKGTGSASALEVGCGEGFSTGQLRAMLPVGLSLEACDVDDHLVAAAAAANRMVPVTRESIYELPRADASVDLVLVLEVLEHLADPRRALSEVLRVSRRWVILSVPREPLWRALNLMRLKYLGTLGNTPGHIRHWSRQSFVQFVAEQAAVQQVRAPWPWTVVLARR